jgi:hypothetical protein
VIFPKLVALTSPDLDESSLPDDPCSCSVFLQAVIGSDVSSGDVFSFNAVTPAHLESAGTLWGRGLLVVPEFAWPTVRSAVERLLLHAARPSWELVAAELNKSLYWEYDNYRPAKV